MYLYTLVDLGIEHTAYQILLYLSEHDFIKIYYMVLFAMMTYGWQADRFPCKHIFLLNVYNMKAVTFQSAH